MQSTLDYEDYCNQFPMLKEAQHVEIKLVGAGGDKGKKSSNSGGERERESLTFMDGEEGLGGLGLVPGGNSKGRGKGRGERGGKKRKKGGRTSGGPYGGGPGAEALPFENFMADPFAGGAFDERENNSKSSTGEMKVLKWHSCTNSNSVLQVEHG
jgi:hypothetical protein